MGCRQPAWVLFLLTQRLGSAACGGDGSPQGSSLQGLCEVRAPTALLGSPGIQSGRQRNSTHFYFDRSTTRALGHGMPGGMILVGLDF